MIDQLTSLKVWLNEMLSAGRTAANLIDDLIAQQQPPAPRPVVVPWLSQLGPDAAYSNSDCGPACVAMWLRSRNQSVTVDQISKSTGLPTGYRYTTPGNLITAGHAFGLELARVLGLTVDRLKQEIDAGRPVLCLVHYASLFKRYDQNFKAGHWVLVIGYTDQSIIYHDPYWPDTAGASIAIPIAQFETALHDCKIDGNTPDQGLVEGLL